VHIPASFVPGLTVNLASLDVIGDILGAATIDLAADGESSTEDLKDGTLELLGKRALTHLASDLNDLVERDGLGVLDVLLLLAVTRRLLEGLDDKGRGGGHNRNLSLTVLDGETDGDTETLLYCLKTPELAICALARIEFVIPYPVASVLGNVFTNLLGRQTKGTDLRSQSRLGSDLTTSHTEVAIDAVSLCIERI